MTFTAGIRTFILSISLLVLAACSAGSNSYTYKPWEFDQAAQQRAATQIPEPIQTPVQQIRAPEAIPQNLPPVKVAILLPLSGRHKDLGDAMLKAAQIALFDIGSTSFELLPRDTQGTATGATKAAQSVLGEGAQLILGPLFSHSVQAVKNTAPKNINIIAFSTDWKLAGGNTFIIGFTPFDQVERVMTYAAQNNITTFGTLAPANDYGRIVATSASKMAPQISANIAHSQIYAQGSGMNAAVKKFASDITNGQTTPPKIQAVFMPSGGREAITVSGLLSKYGVQTNQVKRIGTGLFDEQTLARENSLDGAWFAAPSPKSRRDFENRFRSTYGTFPPRLATLGYDATALAAILAQNGLTKNGAPEFTKAALMNSNGFFGIDGIFRFRPNGLAERGLAVLEFSNGRIRIIDEAPTTFEYQSQF